MTGVGDRNYADLTPAGQGLWGAGLGVLGHRVANVPFDGWPYDPPDPVMAVYVRDARAQDVPRQSKMSDLDRLDRLRDDVHKILFKLQRLPGFDDTLRAIQIRPSVARDYSWNGVRRACRGEIPGFVWRDVFESDLEKRARFDSREALRLTHYRDHNLWRGQTEEGHRVARIEEPFERLEGSDLEQINAYRDEVIAFVERYVFRVGWGPQAVHTALQTGRPLRLPQALPLPYLSSLVTLDVHIGAGEPIAPEVADKLRDWFLELAQHPEHERLAAERRDFLRRAGPALEASPGPTTDLEENLQRYRKETQHVEPPKGKIGFPKYAAGGLRTVERRLSRDPGHDTDTRYYRKLKDLMNPAVNPRSDLVPLQLLDDDEHARMVRIIGRGTRALVGARKLEDGTRLRAESETDGPSDLSAGSSVSGTPTP